MAIVLLALSYLIFWFFIYRRRNKAAKWVFVALTALSIALVPINLPEIIAVGRVYAIADGISFLFQPMAAAMLVRGDAVRWLESKEQPEERFE
jgi:drug/metabolite transporter superfamily protein YnfA